MKLGLALAAIYIGLLHAIVLVAILQTNLVDKVSRKIGLLPHYAYGAEYETILGAQIERSKLIDGAVVFLGDSNIARLTTSRFPGPTENFGVGGDGVAHVTYRAARLDLRKARAIVLQVGVNDWRVDRYRRLGERYETLLRALPQEVPVFVLAINPLNREGLGPRSPLRGAAAHISEANAAIQAACQKRPGCEFIPSPSGLLRAPGVLDRRLSDDGLHLNADGADIALAALNARLAAPAHETAAHPAGDLLAQAEHKSR
jgi:lysophospholipase L1-like esterase